MTRNNEIEVLFSGVLQAFERVVLSPLNLSDRERDDFQERVSLWFDRFTRRPGNEHVHVERLKIPLLSGACHLAREIQKRKGVSIAVLAADPMVVAKQLGLIRGDEEGTSEL